MFEAEASLFTRMEDSARKVFFRYGYNELRTPLLEFTHLFRRGIGEETDVVQKEMFTFADVKGRSMSLRPEATAGVLRAAIEAGLARNGQISRFFTFGPMFRHERPQKGRMRQFHQINCECLGTDSPFSDVDMICMLLDFLHVLEIGGLTLNLNSLGCTACRPSYHAVLRRFMDSVDQKNLCENCRRRLVTNPLRLLDCKEEGCRKAMEGVPHLLDHLCQGCSEHFRKVLHLLQMREIEYSIDHRLVRGLDYYCRTTFEVSSGAIGAQTAVAGGGRYDGLTGRLGGEDAPGAGFACGMERLALLMAQPPSARRDFYIVVPDASLCEDAFMICQNLREAGFSGEMCWQAASMKSQLRQAAKSGALYALILGTDEAARGEVAARNMESGEQAAVPASELAAWLNNASAGASS